MLSDYSNMLYNKIKILFVVDPKEENGNVMRLVDICRNIDTEVYQPLILAFSYSDPLKSLEKENISVRFLPSDKSFSPAQLFRVSSFFKETQVNLVHAFGFSVLPSIFHTVRRSGIPLIYSMGEWSFKGKEACIPRYFHKTIEKYFLKNANRVIIPSKTIKDQASEWLKIDNTRLIYSPVSLNPGKREKTNNAVRELLSIPLQTTLVGYAGKFSDQKDPIVLLEAFRLLTEKTTNVKLLLQEEGALKEKVSAYIQNYDLHEQVILINNCFSAEEILNTMDIYCLPSVNAQYPVHIVEAMAAGTAVIASDSTENLEFVRDGRTGLVVQHGDAEKLSDALLLLHKDRELRDILAKNGFSYSRKFGIKRIVQELESIYAESFRLKFTTDGV